MKNNNTFEGFTMKHIFTMLFVAMALSGCVAAKKNQTGTANSAGSNSQGTEQEIVVQKVDKEDIRNVIREEKMLALDSSIETDITFSAVGEGIAPMNTVSSAQALALAKRAALADGYRQLASKLYGVRVNGKDTVKDAMLRSSTITAQVNGLIKGANIVSESFDQGLYRVNVELKVDEAKWKELFAY